MGNEPFIVAIGASAGGESTLYDFVENLPRDLPAAYIIVQHLKRDYQSQMKFLLSRYTSLPVFTIRDGEEIQPNAIYLIPEHKDASIKPGQFSLRDRPQTESTEIDLDKFFTKLAHALGSRAIGIVLSGIGSDGAAGLKAIEAHGGMVLIQDPIAAKLDCQPNTDIAKDYPDSILPARVMGRYLEDYVRHQIGV